MCRSYLSPVYKKELSKLCTKKVHLTGKNVFIKCMQILMVMAHAQIIFLSIFLKQG